MDSGPRDLRRPDRIRRLVGRHASCTGKNHVGLCPTRRKYLERTRLNWGAQSLANCVTAPLSYPGPTIPPPATWHLTRAPTWTRMVAWPPATWPRTVRLLRPAWATHGSATCPQHCVAPVRWSRVPRVSSPLGPLATSAPVGNKPHFS